MDRSKDRQVLNRLREKEIFCNAQIISSDDVCFSVHSAVLIAGSRYFRSAFLFRPSDAKTPPRETKIIRLHLPVMDAITLQGVINFLYCGEVQLEPSTVWATLLAADFLLMPRLSQLCVSYMRRHLNDIVAAQILNLTHKTLNLPILRDMALKFILAKVCNPRETAADRRRLVRALSPDALEAVLFRHDLNAPHEQLVWYAIAWWFERAEPEIGVRAFPRLLKTLRLGLLPANFVQATVLNNEVVRDNTAILASLEAREKAVQDWLTPNQLSGENLMIEIPPDDLAPRLPDHLVLSVGGWVGNRPSEEILAYDLQADRWTRATALEPPGPVRMAYHGLVQSGTMLYVVGGCRQTSEGIHVDSSLCGAFDLETQVWSSLPSLRVARNFVSCVKMGNLIYAIGGRSEAVRRYRSMEVLDLEDAGEWTSGGLTDMREMRSDAGCAVLDGKIYMMGGFDGRVVVASCEVFDPMTGQWEDIPPMSTKRSGLRCVAAQGCIFVFGGYSGNIRLASTERYDPRARQWRVLSPMRVPRSNLSAVALRDEIVIVAGGFSSSVDNAVELYDIFADTWHDLAPLPTPRSALNIIVLEGQPQLTARVYGDQRAGRPELSVRQRLFPRVGYQLGGEARDPETPLPQGLLYLQDNNAPVEHGEWMTPQLGLMQLGNALMDVIINDPMIEPTPRAWFVPMPPQVPIALPLLNLWQEMDIIREGEERRDAEQDDSEDIL